MKSTSCLTKTFWITTIAWKEIQIMSLFVCPYVDEDGDGMYTKNNRSEHWIKFLEGPFWHPLHCLRCDVYSAKHFAVLVSPHRPHLQLHRTHCKMYVPPIIPMDGKTISRESWTRLKSIRFSEFSGTEISLPEVWGTDCGYTEKNMILSSSPHYILFSADNTDHHPCTTQKVYNLIAGGRLFIRFLKIYSLMPCDLKCPGPSHWHKVVIGSVYWYTNNH